MFESSQPADRRQPGSRELRRLNHRTWSLARQPEWWARAAGRIEKRVKGRGRRHLESACYFGRNGLSLLEVVLALSILAFATAYIAASMQLATQNALTAQRLTRAELVAESIMNQVIAGVIPAQPVTWTTYYSALGNSEWRYQLQNVPAEVEGMIGLQVAVQKIDPNSGGVQPGYDLYINRWIIDPSLGLDAPPEDSEAGSGTDADAASSASATGGAN